MKKETKIFLKGLIIGSIISGLFTYVFTISANITSEVVKQNWLSPKVCVYPCDRWCGSEKEYSPIQDNIHYFPDICIRNPTQNTVKITDYKILVDSFTDIPRSSNGEIQSFEIEPNGMDKQLKSVYTFRTPKDSTPFFMKFCITTTDKETICSERLKFIPQGESLK